MTYYASNELVEVLIKHGFKETTKSIYPDHFKLMEERGEYNPYSIKRLFKRGKIEILFEYINMYIKIERKNEWSGSEISYDQLKSLLFLYSLTPNERYYLKKKAGIFTINEFLNHNKYLDFEATSTKNKINHFKELYSNFSV